MIRDRTEDREVRKILGAEQSAQLAKFLRHIFGVLRITIGMFANIPEEHFALGAILERDQTKIEKREQFFAMFKRIMVILSIILNRDRFF